MLSDFDLAKQSNESGGMPTMVQSEHNGVSSWNMRKMVHCFYCLNKIPMVDTMTCTANFRTNSFVGTEGSRSHYRSETSYADFGLISRVHCAGGYRCARTHGSSGLVDTGDPYIWDDSTCFEKSLLLWRGCWRTIFLFAIALGTFFLWFKYATTPFKGAERNDTFHNIRNQAVQFRDSPKMSSWVEGVMRGVFMPAHQPFSLTRKYD